MQFLQLQDFGGQLNQTFELSLGESAMTLTLIEIQPLPPQIYPGRTRDPFSMIFRSASPIAVPQRLYRIKNEAMGELELFLVPVGAAGGGVIYQAIYN